MIETLINRTTKSLLPDFTVKKESFRLAKEKAGTNLMLPKVEKLHFHKIVSKLHVNNDPTYNKTKLLL